MAFIAEKLISASGATEETDDSFNLVNLTQSQETLILCKEHLVLSVQRKVSGQ